MQLKRAILVAALLFLMASAGLGMAAVITDRYSLFNSEIGAAIILCAIMSLPALAAAYLREKGAWRHVMLFSILLCVVAILAIFGNRLIDEYIVRHRYYGYGYSSHSGSNWAGRFMLCLSVLTSVACTWSVALPIMAGISLVKLKGKSRFLKHMTLFMFSVTTAFVDFWIIAEQLYWIDMHQGDNYLRFLSVLMLLTTGLVLCLPLIYKIQKIDKDAALVSTALDLDVVCPRCRTSQTVHTGHSRCRKCRLKFNIEVEEPRCPHCEYLLHNLTKPVCPECGTELSEEEVTAADVMPAVS